MESLYPFLWRTCTSYNMPVYPGAQRITAYPEKMPQGGIASHLATTLRPGIWLLQGLRAFQTGVGDG